MQCQSASQPAPPIQNFDDDNDGGGGGDGSRNTNEKIHNVRNVGCMSWRKLQPTNRLFLFSFVLLFFFICIAPFFPIDRSFVRSFARSYFRLFNSLFSFCAVCISLFFHQCSDVDVMFFFFTMLIAWRISCHGCLMLLELKRYRALNYIVCAQAMEKQSLFSACIVKLYRNTYPIHSVSQSVMKPQYIQGKSLLALQ